VPCLRGIILLKYFQCHTDRLDNGINTFDTANAYSNGLSEVILGKALKQHSVPREEVVILTKVTFPLWTSVFRSLRVLVL
jgi:aryl-alcohol dehydrogenase-like predicted oxidoreductase